MFHVVLGLIRLELWNIAPIDLYWENTVIPTSMPLVSKLAMPHESLASINGESLKKNLLL